MSVVSLGGGTRLTDGFLHQVLVLRDAAVRMFISAWDVCKQRGLLASCEGEGADADADAVPPMCAIPLDLPEVLEQLWAQDVFMHPAVPWLKVRAVEVVGRMLEASMDLTGLLPGGALSFLALAVACDSEPMAELLLDHGALPTTCGPSGITPLHVATSPTMVRLLAGRGAQAWALSADGATPLLTAGFTPSMVCAFADTFSVEHADPAGDAVVKLAYAGNLTLVLVALKAGFKWRAGKPETFERFCEERREWADSHPSHVEYLGMKGYRSMTAHEDFALRRVYELWTE